MTTIAADSCFFGDTPSPRQWGGSRMYRRAREGHRILDIELGELVAVDYPRAPAAPVVLVSTPKPSAPAFAVDRTEIQAQLEAMLPPLQMFTPAAETVQDFVRAANGKGLNRLSLWLMQALYDADDASDLMAEAVEGGLIATFSYLRRNGQTQVTMLQTDELVLRQAVARRIPRLAVDDKDALSTRLVSQLKSELAFGRPLLVDGATISVVDGKLIAQINKSEPAADPAVQAEPLAA